MSVVPVHRRVPVQVEVVRQMKCGNGVAGQAIRHNKNALNDALMYT